MKKIPSWKALPILAGAVCFGLPLTEAVSAQEAVAAELVKFEGVTLAVSNSAMASGRLPDPLLLRTVLNNYNPRRSGDVYVVFSPNCFINEFDGSAVAATHGSPWRYDTFVPVIFAGGGLKPRKVFREIHTVDVAPTLAAIASTRPGPRRGPGGTIFKELEGPLINKLE